MTRRAGGVSGPERHDSARDPPEGASRSNGGRAIARDGPRGLAGSVRRSESLAGATSPRDLQESSARGATLGCGAIAAEDRARGLGTRRRSLRPGPWRRASAPLSRAPGLHPAKPGRANARRSLRAARFPMRSCPRDGRAPPRRPGRAARTCVSAGNTRSRASTGRAAGESALAVRSIVRGASGRSSGSPRARPPSRGSRRWDAKRLRLACPRRSAIREPGMTSMRARVVPPKDPACVKFQPWKSTRCVGNVPWTEKYRFAARRKPQRR